VRLAWLKRPKIICSPSYVDIRSRANTTRGLDYEHMIIPGAFKTYANLWKGKNLGMCLPQYNRIKVGRNEKRRIISCSP
jgi:hypothetical protein